MTDTPTPRTDAFLDGEGDRSCIVDFARQLERELSIYKEHLSELHRNGDLIAEITLIKVRNMRRAYEKGQ